LAKTAVFIYENLPRILPLVLETEVDGGNAVSLRGGPRVAVSRRQGVVFPQGERRE